MGNLPSTSHPSYRNDTGFQYTMRSNSRSFSSKCKALNNFHTSLTSSIVVSQLTASVQPTFWLPSENPNSHHRILTPQNPLSLQTSAKTDSLNSLKTQLKAHLYKTAFNTCPFCLLTYFVCKATLCFLKKALSSLMYYAFLKILYQLLTVCFFPSCMRTLNPV